MGSFTELFNYALHGIQAFSWVFYAGLFVVALGLFDSAILAWRHEVYKHNLQWILYEIKIPRENLRGPKAMDQVFASIHNLRNHPIWPVEDYRDGEISRWFSFEIVGEGGTTRFFARVPKPLGHAFLASFYAQYPDVELVEVEEKDDYIYDMPSTYQELKAKKYDLYGLEIAQRKDPIFMLKTYPDFESKVGDEKGRIIDPMAGIIEILGRLRPGETAWIQYLTNPRGLDWALPNAQKTIDKMKAAGKHKAQNEPGAEGPFRIRFRTKGEEKTLDKMEQKRGKALFETTLRAIYIAPKAMFNHDLLNRGIFGYVAQLQNDDQRVGKVDRVRTKVEWEGFPPLIFRHLRLFWKKVVIYQEYRERFIPCETFVGKLVHSKWLRWCFFHTPMILCSEELATLFHIPTNVILTAASMERIESKKVAAPSNLPE